MDKQRTLKNTVRATGVGMHTGKKASIVLRPAPPNTGVIFCRTDLNPEVTIPARSEYVESTVMATTLAKGNASISTVEHLLATLCGFGIDNVYIDVDSNEIPVMDGSAGPFVFLLQSAGMTEQEAEKKYIRIKKTISVEDDDKYVRLLPYQGFKIKFSIDFEHPIFHKIPTEAEVDFSSSSFREIARARTFGFIRDIEHLRSRGLALGGSMKNAVVLDNHRILNDEGLRFHDEPVRHKMLDALGDLYLLGYSIVGAFEAHKSGHNLNNKLLSKLLQDKEAWEIVTMPQLNSKSGVKIDSWLPNLSLPGNFVANTP